MVRSAAAVRAAARVVVGSKAWAAATRDDKLKLRVDLEELVRQQVEQHDLQQDKRLERRHLHSGAGTTAAAAVRA